VQDMGGTWQPSISVKEVLLGLQVGWRCAGTRRVHGLLSGAHRGHRLRLYSASGLSMESQRNAA